MRFITLSRCYIYCAKLKLIIYYLVIIGASFLVLLSFKGRFLLFQLYRIFANLFFKLSVSTFYNEISKFQQKSTELKELNWPFCEGFPNYAAHTS